MFAVGREVARGLGERSKISGFRQGKICCALAEEVFGSFLDAIQVASVGNLVEVEVQDLILGEGLLEFEGEYPLFELPGRRLVLSKDGVLDHLLCDGRAALLK